MIASKHQHGQWSIEIYWDKWIEEYRWAAFLDGDKLLDDSHEQGTQSETEALRDARNQIDFAERTGFFEG